MNPNTNNIREQLDERTLGKLNPKTMSKLNKTMSKLNKRGKR